MKVQHTDNVNCHDTYRPIGLNPQNMFAICESKEKISIISLLDIMYL